MNDLELLLQDLHDHEVVQVLRKSLGVTANNDCDNGVDLENLSHSANSLCVLLAVCTTLSNRIVQDGIHSKGARVLLRSFLPRNFSEQTYFDKVTHANAAMPEQRSLNSRVAMAIRLTEAWLDEATGFDDITIAPETLADSWQKCCRSAITLIETLLNLCTGTSSTYLRRTQESTLAMLSHAMRGGVPCLDANAQLHIPGWAERRVEKRFNADTIVVISIRGQKLPGKIVDISRHGFQLECKSTAGVGEVAEILLEGETRGAVVRWHSGGSIGASWLYPLPLDHYLLTGE